MKKQTGFTLIELIMVIVILGILSAFALPRFADLSGDAETAAIQGALASAKSTSSIMHASALANNQTGGTGVISMEGLEFALINGYPDAGGIGTADGSSAANAAGIANAANLNTDYQLIYLASGAFNTTASPANQIASNQVLVTTNPATANRPCFIFTEAASSTAAPTFSAIGTLTAGATNVFTCP